ncbi:MAG TPA: quinone-dependent dihydroorotate dehydrogenase [Candidatus Babeliaceae bacterium]|nr:quinone-dependent dihydroorotate dehydrogenase [Candidatus Babeliaceae bacterium]
MYKLLRNILFWFDAEKVHYFSMNIVKFCCRVSFIKNILQKKFTPKDRLEKHLWGLRFSNPVGLGAGFDKNAKYLEVLSVLGFGFVETGTVTPLPQPGNPKPRLFRLPKDLAIINRMGFNNDGAEIIAQRIKSFKEQNKSLVVGGNIGKNKNTPNEDAWQDYVKCFNALRDCVDYFAVNVSSPNTPGLRDLQQKDSLKKILTTLQKLNDTSKVRKPILLKIAPDLSTDALDEIIDLAMEIKLDGLVATNTTILREGLTSSKEKIHKAGNGGLSGRPLTKISTDITRYIFERTNGSIPVIGSGGVFNGADAREKLNAGASLVQVWTGFIYEGPCIVKNICKTLP